MFKMFSKLFSPLGKLEKIVRVINSLEPEIEKLTDEQLKEESGELREIASGVPLATERFRNDIIVVIASLPAAGEAIFLSLREVPLCGATKQSF